MRNHIRLALSAALVLCVLGCSSSYDMNDVSYENIRRRPAPEMSSTALTKSEGDGSYAYMRNTNYRGAWDDFKRAFLINHPSTLSPYPIVKTSGNPN